MARDIKIRITGDSSGLKSAFGDAEGFAQGFGSRVTSILGAAAKGAALAFGGGLVAAGGILKTSIGAASDFEEAMSKVNTVFGDWAIDIEQFADSAATSLGISRTEALAAAGTYGNLFKAMGFGNRETTRMSTGLIKLSSDLASFNNANPEDVLLALRSGLVGETEPLRQFGVNLNDARIKSEAFRLGLVKANVDTTKLSKAQEAVEKATRKVGEAAKKYGTDSLQYRDAVRDQEQATVSLDDVLAGKLPDSLDAATKAQAAYSLIMQDTSLAQGDFERTSDGLANKQRIITAQFKDLSQQLGSVFLPIALQVGDFILQRVVPALSQFNDWIKGVAATARESGWGAAFGEVVDRVAEVIGSLATRAWDFLSPRLPGWLDSFGQWFKSTAAPWMGDRAAELGGKIAELSRFAWDKLKENLPAWLEAFGKWFTETAVPWVVEKVEAIASAVAGWVPQAWDKTVEKLKEYLKKLETWFENDGKAGGEAGGQSVTEGVIRGLGQLWLSTQTVLAEWQAKVTHWFLTVGAPAVGKGMGELWLQAMQTMAAAAENLSKAAFNIGQDIVAGFINGILDFIDELERTITRFIWAPINTAKKLLGISSPSKVFAAIGGQIAQGLVVGLDAAGSQVAAASVRLAETSMVGFGGAGLTMPAPAGMFTRGPAKTDINRYQAWPVVPLGLGGDSGGSLTLSGGGYGGGGGEVTININGVVGERDAVLRWVAEGLRRAGFSVSGAVA